MFLSGWMLQIGGGSTGGGGGGGSTSKPDSLLTKPEERCPGHQSANPIIKTCFKANGSSVSQESSLPGEVLASC